jgi:hypothetical protein
VPYRAHLPQHRWPGRRRWFTLIGRGHTPFR